MSARSPEAQARAFLRVFPAWMRDDRGEEALGLVLDQLDALPEADRLPWHLRWDLLRAGVQARRRGRPPLSVRLAVAYTGRTRPARPIPVAWLPWLSSALRQRSFPARMASHRMVFMVPILAINLLERPTAGWWWVPASYGVIAVVAMTWATLRAGEFRRRVCGAHGLALDSSLLPPSDVSFEWTSAAVGNVGLRRLLGFGAVGAAVGVPLAWSSSGASWAPLTDPSPTFASTLVPAALVGSWLARALRSPATAGPAVIDAPRPAPAWNRRVGAAGSLATGVVLAMTASLAPFGGDERAFSLTAPALGLVVGWFVVRWREGQAGRWLGVWDVVPSWGPQVAARRVAAPGGPPWASTPPPPRSSST